MVSPVRPSQSGVNWYCEDFNWWENWTVLATAWPFIEIDERGIPLVKGTRIKVAEIVADHRAYQWNAEQIQIQHPHLSLPQIHAALGYYYEHQEECDQQIVAALQRADEICRQAENPALRTRLQVQADS
jgi:uncharacterized protein (DUF433 family)